MFCPTVKTGCNTKKFSFSIDLARHRTDLSGIFSIADGYRFSIKHIQEFCQFFLGVFQYTGNFHLIKSPNNCATGNALNKTEFLSGFCSNRNSFKFMIFTRWAFRPCHIVTLGKCFFYSPVKITPNPHLFKELLAFFPAKTAILSLITRGIDLARRALPIGLRPPSRQFPEKISSLACKILLSSCRDHEETIDYLQIYVANFIFLQNTDRREFGHLQSGP